MKIQKWIKQKGYKQGFIAKRVKIEETRFSKICTGAITPSLHETARIYDYTNGEVTLHDFLEEVSCNQ